LDNQNQNDKCQNDSGQNYRKAGFNHFDNYF